MVDELDDLELEAAARVISRLREDPFLAALESVPYDDEPLTTADIEAIERSRADYAAGRHKSLDEVKRALLGE